MNSIQIQAAEDARGFSDSHAFSQLDSQVSEGSSLESLSGQTNDSFSQQVPFSEPCSFDAMCPSSPY